MENSPVHETEHTTLGLNNRKLGIWVFLGSEAVFFGGLISAFIVLSGRSVTGPYPKDVLSLPLVSVNTFVLIASSLAMVTALSAIQRGDVRKAIAWLGATVVLGLAFLGGQAYEFTHLYQSSLTLQQNLFGASFFTLTGTHGLHVFSGVIWIILVMIQLWRQRGMENAELKIELVGLYWHFVDLVWIIIFTVVYLLQ